jgi:probable aminopeptidase NPEPL1
LLITVSLSYFCTESGDEATELTPEELKVLDDAAIGIRLAARIVDTPCNEMNVDNFLQVKSHNKKKTWVLLLLL